MCGVVAALAYNDMPDKASEKARQEASIIITTELLKFTQDRGKDATGISTVFDNGDYIGLKMGISSEEFVTRFGGESTDYEGYTKLWREKNAKITIGHCRKPSTASLAATDDNTNNHPIKVGNIVGVHNGTLSNHEVIFDNLKCKRDGKVDSEAIFRLLHSLTNGGSEPFSPEVIKETCKRLAGSYACLAFNADNPFQMAAFRDARPLEIAVVRPLKLVIVSSDKTYIKKALIRYNEIAVLYSSKVKMPKLNKSSVDMEMLPDDSYFLFDVRNDITDQTKVSDLFTTGRVPRNEKMWITKSTAVSAVSSTAKTTALAVVDKPVVVSPVTKVEESKPAESGKTKPITGMVWDQTTEKYISVGMEGIAEKHGNVEIGEAAYSIKDVKDCEEPTKTSIVDKNDNSGKVWSQSLQRWLLPGEKTANKFTIAPAEKVDDLIADPAKVCEISVNERTEVTEIEELADPSLLKAAEKATKECGKFSNNAELVAAIDISDVDRMLYMERYSLANRIKDFFFKAGFLKGYLEYKNDHKSSHDVGQDKPLNGVISTRMREKVERSSTIIRNLKNVVSIMGSLSKEVEDAETCKKAIKKMIDSGKELDYDVLTKAFKIGDQKEIPLVNSVMSKLKELNDEVQGGLD